MPELPEVETVVREIRPLLVGRSIVSCKFLIPRQLQPQSPRAVAGLLKARTIVDVTRRGKYILIGLDRGILLVHLRMSGRLYVRPANSALHKHERAAWTLDNGTQLILRDPRTLGTIRCFKANERIAQLELLGWEPLSDEVGGETLKQALHKRKMAIKPVLLDQSLYAGIGNIYASESLWEAGINPRKPAMKLTGAECHRLAEAVPSVLRRALEHGGSTLRDFMKPDGTAGAYQKEFRVYDRESDHCPRCRTPLKRIVQAQRSTYYCPTCQKMTR